MYLILYKFPSESQFWPIWYRYECEKPVITKEDEDTSDETSTDIVRDEVETTIATTSYPETTSTQVYEIRFEKVPLFKARKDDQDSVDVTTTGNNAGPYMVRHLSFIHVT